MIDNCPSAEVVDTPIYREVYRDLKRSGTIKNMTYFQYLGSMKERNLAMRKDAFEKRRITTRLDLSSLTKENK